jgi:hypothetical protein
MYVRQYHSQGRKEPIRHISRPTNVALHIVQQIQRGASEPIDQQPRTEPMHERLDLGLVAAMGAELSEQSL